MVCCGRQVPRLQETADRIRKQNGQARAVQVDITDQRQVERMKEAALAAFGTIDILINNAGRFNCLGGFWETDPDQWWRDVEVNLKGTMLCCRAVLPHFMKAGRGIIINLSGGGALGPNLGASGYGASKAAVLRLTDTLAGELQQEKSPVMVFALDPGFNRTAMTASLAEKEAARKWSPWLAARLEQDDGTQVEKAVATAQDLIGYAAPDLSGRIFTAGDDIKNISRHAARIRRQDELVLRLKTLS